MTERMQNKYYKHQDIKAVLTCNTCGERFRDPRVLPCGRSACFECINRSVMTDSNVGQERVQCACDRRGHRLPMVGFPPSEAIIHLMNLHPREVNTSRTARLLSEKLRTLTGRRRDLNAKMHAGTAEIYAHAARIKDKVADEVERLKARLDKCRDEIMGQIDEYAVDRATKYQVNATVWTKLVDFSEKVDDALHTGYRYLAREDQVEADLQVLTKHIDYMTGNMNNRESDLKSMLFSGSVIDLKRNEKVLESKIIGELTFKKYTIKETMEIDMQPLCTHINDANSLTVHSLDRDARTFIFSYVRANGDMVLSKASLEGAIISTVTIPLRDLDIVRWHVSEFKTFIAVHLTRTMPLKMPHAKRWGEVICNPVSFSYQTKINKMSILYSK
jgi:hypothetical protein